MAIPTTYTNWPKNHQQAERSFTSAQSYISEYDKHRRYYYRDYDDRYQVDSYIEQQFESIPHPLHIRK